MLSRDAGRGTQPEPRTANTPAVGIGDNTGKRRMGTNK